jgi:hypothetical protein
LGHQGAMGAPQNSGHKAIYFISQILGSKIPQKSKEMLENLNKTLGI